MSGFGHSAEAAEVPTSSAGGADAATFMQSATTSIRASCLAWEPLRFLSSKTVLNDGELGADDHRAAS